MKLIKDICYGKCDFDSRKLDIYLPDAEEFPVFIYFHGGGIERGDKAGIEIAATELANSGVCVVSANYSLYPDAVYPEFIRDAAAAVAWTKKHINEYGKCEKFYIGGSSAGGYISMMLCFDKKYLAPYKLSPTDFAGFIHDAGQPTAHFNVLRERGIDSRRVIIDESAPLYHIGTAEEYPNMLFIVSDDDMPGRYAQTELVIATLRHFGYDEEKFDVCVMRGKHCHYVRQPGVFSEIIAEFIEKCKNK